MSENRRKGLSPQAAWQSHHDLFVRLFRWQAGQLDQFDLVDYETAMEREKREKVQPLPEDDEEQ